MRRRLLLSGLLAALSMAAPRAEAQSVSADVWIGTGPVFGRVHIGEDPHDYYLRRRYERPVVIVQPRVIVVERVRPRGRGWSHGWYRNFRRDHRVVVVYYDARRDRYYDRPFRRGLHEVRVYERGGRHYWLDARDRDWDDDRRYRDWDDDRRYRDRDWDDRRYGDRDWQRRDGDQDRRDRDGRRDRDNDRDREWGDRPRGER